MARPLGQTSHVLVALLACTAPGRADATPEGADPAPRTRTANTPLAARAADGLARALTSTRAGTYTSTTPAPRAMNLYSLLYADDLAATIAARAAEPGPFPARLERMTRGMVGAPYVFSPLGEAAEPDLDPRFRLDAFDCTTFVETALAFARCDGLPEIQRELDQIRYASGDAAYAKRRHLVTAQWIPDLTALGYVEELTAEVGDDETVVMVLTLDATRWKKRAVARKVSLGADDVPLGTFELPYLPIAVAIARARDGRIPAGTIINAVRREWVSSPEVITHQGLVLARPEDGAIFVRHASPISKRVIDEPLLRMLERYEKPRTPKAWPIIGVNLLRIVDPESTSKP